MTNPALPIPPGRIYHAIYDVAFFPRKTLPSYSLWAVTLRGDAHAYPKFPTAYGRCETLEAAHLAITGFCQAHGLSADDIRQQPISWRLVKNLMEDKNGADSRGLNFQPTFRDTPNPKGAGNRHRVGSADVIRLDYQGMPVTFDDGGWINGTVIAARFDKRIEHWLENQDTREYVEALCNVLNTRNSGDLIRTKRGKNGGTWLHPKLAVVFARWLDVGFAVWCDLQIDGLIRREHPHYDRLRARDAAASSYKVMAEILRLTRQDQGKATGSVHYITETRLVNWALTGEFRAVDRDALTREALALLASLEDRNAVLLGRGPGYPARKVLLEQHVLDWRAAHPIEGAAVPVPIAATVGALPAAVGVG